MATNNTQVPFGVIADCFRNHSVVPFLGAASSFVGVEGPQLPDARTLAATLAAKSNYPGSNDDPLTKVAQYLEEVAADRSFLLDEVTATFYSRIPDTYTSALTAFLTAITSESIPKLLITTNYDVTIERALEARKVGYLAISHIVGDSKYRGRLFCYDSLAGPGRIATLSQINSDLVDENSNKHIKVVLYKIHGTARPSGLNERIDSVVLTEGDYIRFLTQDTFRSIPIFIQERLRYSRLLYLGYSLQDWNFRVLLNRVREMQRAGAKADERRHWACLLNPDTVESRFWAKRGVEMYRSDLGTFLRELQLELLGSPA